ncbi:phage tail protein [Lysinibacillus louembei]|uniref:Phage tail protein n=1 Tax=Lysinibacillus louembei TaxID=1470088 RepID=A0ABZ0RYP4_9BACI|nr:phage tail protein [Lysinibacillus louembei]WPK12595.1 phage tail protein [Lysinibacillus louembei]
MFYVTNLDGSQVEPLINIGSDFKMEQAIDGTLTVSFSCFPSNNNDGYELLQAESMVTIMDYDFRVKQLSHTAQIKTVTAISIFYDHAKTQQHNIFNSSSTLQNYINFALQGTEWEATIDRSIANLISDIGKFGNDNVVSLITKICKVFQCEYLILPNKRLYFAKQIGGDYDYQYRYKHNVSSVVRKEDTANLTTVMRGYGKDGLEVIYRSPKADIFGELEAEPIHDEQFTNAQAFKEYMASQIQDEPELVIESAIPELTKREIGERVWLIYEPLNIEMQTRILQQIFILQNGQLVTSSIVLGNTTNKSSTDLFVEQQEKLKETKEKLTETKTELKESIDEAKKEFQSKIEQTDNQIKFEVEELEKSIAAIDVKADHINISVNNRITDEMAVINFKADNINISVNNRITNEVAEINARANEINLSVKDLEYNTNASIGIMQHNISSKVSQTDYNGNTIASLINQTATDVTIQANRINLNGAVIVNGTISGATSINVQESIVIGTTLQIGQNWQSTYPKAIRFAGQYSTAGIAYNGGSLVISATNGIELNAEYIRVVGRLDANVQNAVSANSINGYTMTYTSTGGKKYITFRQNGSYLGQVEIN